ncbi:hypothetical protein LN96_11885 [Xanthomonas citri pv. citri]|uniref:Uncharacterized protein n=1 Tax=Xanthomonas axonopodis pv. cajani TaxID=487827 RepID=A0ABX3MFF8_9XANT|nr:hypothetical protein XAC29_09445 [Xanthomonas axonopodis Xac29-1]AKM24978.1 hypothetical protein AB890_09480 [Xanthomonas citri pv. citri]OOW74078.1 hypothetical protein Xmar_11835 [Xanthomonas axonopodis pv. martyniicola]OOX21052.1 hypothetical protein Xcaj_02870 [Xanthomonas axonopodis pv. cajani]OMG04927.1 hypothetical protein LN96_11885 [Xanthomonas citri pv. citri]
MLLDEPGKKRPLVRRVHSFFNDDILQCMVFHRQLGVHAFELAVLRLQVAKALHISGLHAVVLGLPDVVSRLGNAQLVTDILDLATALDLLQRGDDLALGELALRIVCLLGG